jgi:hypothetical protein
MMRLRRRLYRPVVVAFEYPHIASLDVGMYHDVAIGAVVIVVVDERWS